MDRWRKAGRYGEVCPRCSVEIGVSKRGSAGEQDEKSARPLLCVNSELSQHQRQKLVSHPPSPTSHPPLGIMTVLWREMVTGCLPLDRRLQAERPSLVLGSGSGPLWAVCWTHVSPPCISDSSKATTPPTKETAVSD